MKAIILAAGMGTRLGKYTQGKPKCMLEFRGKPLLQWQVGALRKAGINDIVVVGGYEAEKLQAEGVTFRTNLRFASTNMVGTLMAARDDLKTTHDGILVAYADILYEPRLVKAMAEYQGDIGVMVDEDWQDYWKARLDDWESDVESLVMGPDGRITELGTPRCPLSAAMARYVGLIRFSRQGVQALMQVFDENQARFGGKAEKWRQSKSFDLAYMTCMLQELIARGTRVQAVYERTAAWDRDGTLARFIRVDTL